MTLDGLQTIYKSVVSYQPAAVSIQETLPPDLPLRANQMLEFSTTADASAILALANQVCPPCTLTGGTQPLTATVFAGTGIIAPNGEPCYGQGPGGLYLFHTADGPRPYVINNAAIGLTQIIGSLVAAWKPGNTTLHLVGGPSGPQLAWS